MDREKYLRKFEYFKGRNLSHSFDCLTGLLNRETMVGYINSLVGIGKPFSFFLLDIDNFKNVNDTYGHMAGDAALSETAKFLLGTVGDCGVVGRYGGDEFILVFEGITEYKDVWNIGHKINMSIGNVVFDTLHNLSLTVSMGIARYPIDAYDYGSVLATADKALYRGKMKGRNCFIIYLAEKHANIDTNKERNKNFSAMHMCARVFDWLTSNEDVQESMKVALRSLAAFFMFDHICVESKKGMNYEIFHLLSKQKKFTHIPIEDVDAVVDSAGCLAISKMELMNNENYDKVVSELKEQKIVSNLCCKISAFGKTYGFIRIDMCDTPRIWQTTEVDVIITTARFLGALLYYQGKTLEDLPEVEIPQVGTVEQ